MNLPYPSEAELSVAGAIVADAACLPDVLAIVSAEDFYGEPARRVVATASRLLEKGEMVDPTSVFEEARNMGKPVQMEFIAEAMAAHVTTVVVPHHARIVRDASALRSLHAASQAIALDVTTEPRDEVAAILARAQQRVLDVSGRAESRKPEKMRKLLMPVLAQIQDRTIEPTGMGTGLRSLDDLLIGFRPGDFVIVAGRPSMGKTALTTGIVLHLTITEQRPGVFMTLEMSRDEMVSRALCYEGMVDLSRVFKGTLLDDDYPRLAQAAGHLNTAPLWVDELAGPSIAEVRARARRQKAEQPDLAWVVVDYIQLMAGDGQENRQQEVSAISRGLKAMAKELQVTVFGVSQLSRETEKRANQRPHLSDLRESGSLEQDADLVLFTYRPEYYATPADIRDKGLDGKAEIIVPKQRNGPTGTVEVYFRKHCARFEDLTHDWRDRVA